MYRLLQEKLNSSSILRYIFIGGVSYVIELSCIFIISTITNNPVLSVGIGFWFGLGASFFLQKIFAFKNTSRGVRQLTMQSVLYLLLVALNYSFTLWLVWQFTAFMGLFIARTVALVITTTWNYFLYKDVIFR